MPRILRGLFAFLTLRLMLMPLTLLLLFAAGCFIWFRSAPAVRDAVTAARPAVTAASPVPVADRRPAAVRTEDGGFDPHVSRSACQPRADRQVAIGRRAYDSGRDGP